MHRLHLLRHAKAERDAPGDDKTRPLTRRGRDDARRVGAILPAAIGALDLVLCSPSRRTRETAELVLAGFAPAPRILYGEALYLAGTGVVMRRLRDLDETTGAVLVIGHNPGLHELAIVLAAPHSPHGHALAAGTFPTTARASFAVAVPWSGLDRGRHLLTDYATPKSLG